MTRRTPNLQFMPSYRMAYAAHLAALSAEEWALLLERQASYRVPSADFWPRTASAANHRRWHDELQRDGVAWSTIAAADRELIAAEAAARRAGLEGVA